MRFGVTTPSREEFAALDQPVVPVTRRLLADSETAVGIYRKLAGNRAGTVLLESAEQGKRWARYSFVGVRSAGVLTERGGVTEWLGDAVPGLTDDLPEDPLAAVRTLARRMRTSRVEGLPPLTGGLVGYLGYDVVRRLERLPETSTDDLGMPELAISSTVPSVWSSTARSVTSIIASSGMPRSSTLLSGSRSSRRTTS